MGVGGGEGERGVGGGEWGVGGGERGEKGKGRRRRTVNKLLNLLNEA